MILFVEDEEALRVAVSLFLQKNGFSVLPASDGAAALDAFRQHMNDIDIVLLDVTLPGLSGAEVYRELVSMKPELEVLLTTAYNFEQVSADFVSEREAFLHFIRKPYSLRELVRTLQDLLSHATRNSPGS